MKSLSQWRISVIGYSQFRIADFQFTKVKTVDPNVARSGSNSIQTVQVWTDQWGVGQLVERRTRDLKTRGSNPVHVTEHKTKL